MKKLISTILIFCCLLTLLPLTASAKTGGKLIALTFDDGPCNDTARLLDGLAERNVRATFFMLGEKAKSYPETVRRMYTEGHQLASHSYDHPQLTKKTDSQVRWQVERTDEILDGHLGLDFDYLLRPPYGDCNSRVLSLIGVPAIMWSIDPLDWKYRDVETVRSNIVSAAHDGAIILAHDIHRTTVDGALKAVDDLLAQGYEFVTVNELFRRRGETLNAGSSYRKCSPNGVDLGPVAMPDIRTESTYGGLRITITAEDGADIFYTTDGSDPALKGMRYTGALDLASGTVIKAIAAYNRNGSRSEAATVEITGAKVKEPSVHVQEGRVVFHNPNSGVDIRYTTDGTAPTAQSALYSEPIPCFNGKLTYCLMGDGVKTVAHTVYVTNRGNLFWDVPSEQWYADVVDRAVALGLFNGVGTYRFDPEGGVSRAMYVAVLFRLAKELGLPDAGGVSVSFVDVENGLWYTEAVQWAARNEIVNGYGDGTFRPDKRISRQEMCVMLDRTLQWAGQQMEKSEKAFADADEIADWAADSVSRVTASGLILGRGGNRFAPTETATRAEAATVMLRLYDLLKAE